MGSKTWNDETEARFMSGRTVKAFGGLYMYGAWGTGYFYHPDKRRIYCSPSEGRAMAKEAGVEYVHYDSFSGYQPVALGDR